MKVCAVSVDLDEIGEYRSLHGLPAREAGAHAVYDLGLVRALELMGGRALTLFAIGKDLAREASAESLSAASRRGAVVENHSHGHAYDLCRLPAVAIEADIARATEAIAAVTGRRPRGFRSPGYGTSASLLSAVARAGLSFDASALPSPPYYLAKLFAMARVRVRRRRSAAILHPPASAFGPRLPHRVAPGLVEIPMTVTPRARLPVIGTSLTLAGRWAARRLLRGCLDDDVLSLELHGIDFLDARDGIADLRPHQPDVREPLGAKLRTFAAVLDDIQAAGFSFVPLEDVALQYARDLI